MNQDIKTEWVTALRSGTYAQGVCFLHRIHEGRETFCCLGVLADIAVKHNIITSPTEIEMGDEKYYVYGAGGHYSHCILPDTVAKWAGITSDVSINKLIIMNDEGHTIFAQIADYIETNL